MTTVSNVNFNTTNSINTNNEKAKKDETSSIGKKALGIFDLIKTDRKNLTNAMKEYEQTGDRSKLDLYFKIHEKQKVEELENKDITPSGPKFDTEG